MFSNECRICLEGKTMIVRGSTGEADEDSRKTPSKFITPCGGGSIIVWAGIMAEGRTDLVLIPPLGLNAQRYIDEILNPHVVPFRLRVRAFSPPTVQRPTPCRRSYATSLSGTHHIFGALLALQTQIL